jgi:hypothetical protein
MLHDWNCGIAHVQMTSTYADEGTNLEVRVHTKSLLVLVCVHPGLCTISNARIPGEWEPYLDPLHLLVAQRSILVLGAVASLANIVKVEPGLCRRGQSSSSDT